MNFQQTLEQIIAIAKQAGEIPRHYIQKPINHSQKSNAIDLVTDADRETEAFIVEALQREFPAIGIVGEEGGSYQAETSGDYHWFVDPIDGTTNFAHRLPHFAVMIALAQADYAPVLGVIYDPMRDECFSAYRGGGAYLNGEPIQVSETTSLVESLVTTGFPYDRHTNPDNNLREWNAMKVRTQGGRRLGSAGLDLAYVACGRVDGYWEQRLNRWDCLPGILLVQEAGGKVTDYKGRTEGLYEQRVSLVASNGHIHQALLEVIQTARKGIEAP